MKCILGAFSAPNFVGLVALLVCDSKRKRAFRRALGKFYRLGTPKGRQTRLVVSSKFWNIALNIHPKMIQNPYKINQKWFYFWYLLGTLQNYMPRFVQKSYPEIMKKHQKSIPHWSKILPKSTKKHPKSIKIASLERFRHQIAPGSVPGRPGSFH